jgi:hypothetical protein
MDIHIAFDFAIPSLNRTIMGMEFSPSEHSQARQCLRFCDKYNCQLMMMFDNEIDRLPYRGPFDARFSSRRSSHFQSAKYSQ